MRRLTTAVLITTLSLAVTLQALAFQSASGAASRVIGEVSANGQQMQWLQMLSDEIGSRLTGSTGCRRAEEVMEAEMKRKSVWSPQDCQVFLSFLVDPQWEWNRMRGEGIWAVKASLTTPIQWVNQEGDITLTLGRGWEERLLQFFSDLSALRDKHLGARG